jgi:effector-binding domain-containing protein
MTMAQQIEVVDAQAEDATVLRDRVTAKDIPRNIMPMFARIQQMVGAGTLPADARHVWIFRYREDGQVDAEIGILTSAPPAGGEGLVATRTPAGSAAHAVHIGDFSKLGAVHSAVSAWCDDNGRTRAGVSWEVYSDLHQPPDKRRCDVYYLLK